MQLFKRFFGLISKQKKLETAQLRKWNLILAFLYAVQGIVILIVGNAYNLSVTTNYLAVDPLESQTAGHQVMAAATHHLFDVNLVYLLAAVLFVSAIIHLLVATTYNASYEAGINKGINQFRWGEYAFSASMMIVITALLVGIYDFSTLLMLFGLTVMVSLLGLIGELHNNKRKQTKNYLINAISTMAAVIPWMVIVIYITSSGIYGNRLPTFVYWLVGSMFVLAAGFIVNIRLQQCRYSQWSDYLYGERVYMVLSLIAKTALTWQIFAGVLH
jgi:hypothetical protein